ncbi:MAG: DUF2285 domain-containing protein [Alphaproteobacteria bacterium]|nr:DUF2285 domain-containing protein [Alphaproteobacteria bacterium]MDE2494695.1 DUF2285 domain-containing protein [Alphaproteobacteria bacterium]
MWRADADPSVLTVDATPTRSDDPDAFDIKRLTAPLLVVKRNGGGEHLLVGDETCQLRLDVPRGTVLDGPVRLRYELVGTVALEAKLLTLRRLLALLRLRRIPRALAMADRRARRWMMALRAWDAHAAGVTHRDIAVILFGMATVDADWNGGSGYLRCRVQRRIRLGERLVHGGYRQLLK